MYDSSPVLDTRDSRRKAAQNARDEAQMRREEQAAAEAEQAARLAEAVREAKLAAIENALDCLTRGGASLGDLLLHVFGEGRDHKWRWWNFFKETSVVDNVISAMASKHYNLPRARAKAEGAMLNVIVHTVEHEARRITRAGTLRPPKEVDENFVLGFKFHGLVDTILPRCPTIARLLLGICQTKRQTKDCTLEKLDHKRFLTAIYAALLLGERSQYNSWFRHVFGLYLYSQGASRQLITVLNHLGISMSYVTIVGRGGNLGAVPERPEVAAQDGTEEEAVEGAPTSASINDGLPNTARPLRDLRQQAAKPGTLQSLSLQMREKAREMARNSDFMVVYDNINMMWRVAEQILGRTDSMESGTCATAMPLHDADPKHLDPAVFYQHFDDAEKLEATDLMHTEEYKAQLRRNLVHTVLRIIVRRGGDAMRKKFGKEVRESQPSTSSKIPVHATKIHPLPTMHIDEQSRQGNADLITEIMDELGQATSDTERADKVRLVAGDQLSMARIREVGVARAGNDGNAASLRHLLLTPGFFHYKMSATAGLMQTYLGTKNRDLSNPASIHAHNTLLRRKPLTATSLPPFRQCRDILFISGDARILTVLLKVSGKASLEEYAADADITFDVLQRHAEQIVDQYANPEVARKLRRARDRGDVEAGDMVFENAVLFLRDVLLLREFTDAIKGGDSGRIITVLESWVFSYRAQGRPQYAGETLRILHNYKKVWPPGIRDIMLRNWLVNTTGKPNAFLEVDLLQEHLNYWIKTYFQAHGSNASWEWLATVSPCVIVLRSLANEINDALGSKQGKRHTTPDLTKDIHELMASLQKHNVYEVVPGRRFDADDSSLVDDAVSTGFVKLIQPTAKGTSPLDDYNTAFTRLQRAYRITPIVGGPPTSSEATSSETVSSDTASAPLETRSRSPTPDGNEDTPRGVDQEDSEETGISFLQDNAGLPNNEKVQEFDLNKWFDDYELSEDEDDLLDVDADGETDPDVLSNKDSDVESVSDEEAAQDAAPGEGLSSDSEGFGEDLDAIGYH
ncbi:hypothetical protein K525DRAFT_270399 [Schizophyllum commune Loenen D]|nr:hypothetical protein K525DRAFT_270399 [Schizophyllum commune Loenen D]